MSKKPARMTPSQRLAAVAPAAKPVEIEKPTTMRVGTKFVVVDKQEIPSIIGHDLVVKYRVDMQAAYEAKSVHHGLATEQGNVDNKIFGLGKPDAAIVMIIESKAIADTFVTGHAFAVEFTEIVAA